MGHIENRKREREKKQIWETRTQPGCWGPLSFASSYVPLGISGALSCIWCWPRCDSWRCEGVLAVAGIHHPKSPFVLFLFVCVIVLGSPPKARIAYLLWTTQLCGEDLENLSHVCLSSSPPFPLLCIDPLPGFRKHFGVQSSILGPQFPGFPEHFGAKTPRFLGFLSILGPKPLVSCFFWAFWGHSPHFLGILGAKVHFPAFPCFVCWFWLLCFGHLGRKALPQTFLQQCFVHLAKWQRRYRSIS